MDRREFIEKSVVGGTAIALLGSLNCQSEAPQGLIPKRRLGRSEVMLSIIGFGGIMVSEEEQTKANEMVAQAVDRGVNYFDVAPTYGNAQDRLGPALKPYRKNSFLACKTTQRKAEDAERELHESLKALQTDYFDLYQLHAITTKEDVETAFGPGGAMEVFLKAKEQGKVRFLGFSAHSEEAALLAMEKYDFDTVLFPINFVCWYHGDFGPRVVEKAKESNKGILALKALALRRYGKDEERIYKKAWYHPVPLEDEAFLSMALRWTLSQGTTAAIPPGAPEFFPKALDIAASFKNITEEETKELIARSEGMEPVFKRT